MEAFYEGIRHWAKKEKTHNPSFALVLGRKSFTIDQLVEHLEKDTEDGREIKKWMFMALPELFTNYDPKPR